ncbi:MAG: ATP-dependent RNA helicase RhlE, partial [Sulfitobacter sp.]
TKKGADRLTRELSGAGLEAGAIHGDKSQAVRLRNLQAFKTGELKILVATDVASRGLDIGDLPVVINIDLPKVAEDYVHRIGRTGRANKIGEAVSLVSADEFENLRNIEQLVRHVIPREVIDHFDPSDDVPLSNGVPPARKPKKPKKPKKLKI